jgi:hypothetical protein
MAYIGWRNEGDEVNSIVNENIICRLASASWLAASQCINGVMASGGA